MFDRRFAASSLLVMTVLGFGCLAPALAQKKSLRPTKRAAPPAKVAAVPAPPPIPAKVEFLRDVAPILDRNSCSTAACHGKFGGRGGFQVSLLTLSPEDDYEPIVYGARGRRINFVSPDKSLLLLKAAGQVPHGGGSRFTPESRDYQVLLRWIKNGAPFDEKDPRPVSFALEPSKATLQRAGQKLQIRAIATFSDGSRRDVTSQTVFDTTNSAILGVSTGGLVTGNRWGGGVILARYLGNVTAAFVTLPQDRKGTYPTIAVNNVIDQAVFGNLKQMNILPSELSSDEEFLRRVTLDTLGRLPTPAEITTFVAEKSTDKRAKLIDDLLERTEYVDYRTMRLCDLLRVSPRKLGNNQQSERFAALFYEWIWKSVESNKPWDQFVREVITARGSNYQVGPASFYRVERNANDRMENIGQAFLGVRMSCARCHKHPFDRWTTDDYWNFAAFMGKVSARGGKLDDEAIITYAHNQQIRNQSVTGRNRNKIAPPTFLGEKQPAEVQPDMIVGLANWVTNEKNPFFARATVNRLWSYYFGRGIINPVDDMRVTSAESVPGLLDALAAEFVKSKYDTKYLTKLILNSRTYQLSAVPNSSNVKDDTFFSRSVPKPMPAQVLLDMLNQASGVEEQFSPFSERSRVVQATLPVNSVFLSAFGQSHREFLADIDPKLEPNLVQTLMMINSPYVENKIRNGKTVAAALKETTSDEDLVKYLYLRTLNRLPTTNELSRAVNILKTGTVRKDNAQDLLWALLTAREFYFNH